MVIIFQYSNVSYQHVVHLKLNAVLNVSFTSIKICGIYLQQNIVQPFKKEENLTHAMAWMKPEDMMVNEISRTNIA